MATTLSRSQIDRLGDRLRQDPLADADLRLLDEYRRSFGEAYEKVVRAIRERLRLEPTGRPAKSTGSIIEKLHRESIRLVQVQDIAGCRIVVDNRVEQDRILESLSAIFPEALVVDRRANPSFGYRAVHVIVEISGKAVEIQVRSALQHLWAEVSEKLSDVIDPTIKYGGGPHEVRSALGTTSELVASFDELEAQMADVQNAIAELPQDQRPEHREQLAEIQQTLLDTRKQLVEALKTLIAAGEKREGRKT